MKIQTIICLFVIAAFLSSCKTAQRTPPPMPPTSSPPTSSSPPSTPSQESSSRRSSPSQDPSSKPSSSSPSQSPSQDQRQSPSSQPSMPTQETAQSKPSSSGQPSTSEPAGASEQREAAENLKKAGQQVADAGAQLPQGASGSEQPAPSPTSTPGDEEWDPLMLPDEAAASAAQSDAVADAEAGGAESAAAESAESAAADSGASGSEAADAESTNMAGASGDAGIEDPLMDEIQAAQEALQEAGIALETAGGALETATSSEELAAAEAALARARVSVIVAGQDLLDLKELVTDPSMGEIIDQAEEALNQANGAIVIASDSIFSTRISLPEFEEGQVAGGGGGNGSESELDKELNDSIIVFENQILEARNDVIGSAPAPTSAENIPGVAVLGGTLEDGGDEGSFEENQDTLIIGEESEVTQQGRMPEGAELASVEENVPSLIPDDIPDPQGDDIVAQQLREAAVAETDPALREKLWEEYRRYKAGL